MIYHYDIKVEFLKGKHYFYKDYVVSFTNIASLFDFLEKKHKYNYTVISIKEHKPTFGSFEKFNMF